MRSLFFLVFVLSSAFGFSQKEDIDIIQEDKGNDATTFFAKNNTKDMLTIEFTVDGTGFTSDKGNKVTVGIKPLAKQEILTVTPIAGQMMQYSMGYKYYKGGPAPTNSLEEKPVVGTISEADLANGIVLFSKNGCGRCSFAVKYLKEKNIPFREVNISENKSDASLMWKQLEKAGFGGTSVQTPVISVNGKINPQISDLKTFLSGLN